MYPQLPLPFTLQEDFNFESFIATENQLIVESLKKPDEPFIFLWGSLGTGKTHLLQSACQYQTQLGGTASYLPSKELTNTSPQLLDGLANIDLICIDDIESLYGKPYWEEALFNLFNQIRQVGGRLVVSSTVSPQHAEITLNDLKSRLNSGLPLNLSTLSDESILQALQSRAQKIGLELNRETANYLITHFPRDLHTLWSLLNQLDQASLAAQRKLTIPFLKAALAKSI